MIRLYHLTFAHTIRRSATRLALRRNVLFPALLCGFLLIGLLSTRLASAQTVPVTPPERENMAAVTRVYLPLVARPEARSQAEINATISGRVVDADQQPLTGIQVFDGTGNVSFTDSNGFYTFDNLATGTYTITLSAQFNQNFQPFSHIVSVPAEDTQHDFVQRTQPTASPTTQPAPTNRPVQVGDGTNPETNPESPDTPTPSPATPTTPPDAPTASPTTPRPTPTPDVPRSSIETGFVPQRDGYHFANWSSAPGEDSVLSTAELRALFGDEVVCVSHNDDDDRDDDDDAASCQLRVAAQMWLEHIDEWRRFGHCDGFTITSWRFFEGIESPADFQPGADTTYDLQFDNVSHHIYRYWALQFVDEIARERAQALQKSPAEVLEQLLEMMTDDEIAPTSLLVYNPSRSSGHSVTPYAIDEMGDGIYRVRVYDNEHPDDESRYVEINSAENTWSYQLNASMRWAGDAETRSLGTISIDAYEAPFGCPWCDTADTNAELAQAGTPVQTWLRGGGHLLISDAHEQEIGYRGTQFVDTMPDAFAAFPPNLEDTSVEPVYYLPEDSQTTIWIDGQTLTQPETARVTQFGPAYAVSVEGVQLRPATREQLTIADHGTTLAYRAASEQTITLTLALEHNGSSLHITLDALHIAAGEEVRAQVDLAAATLTLTHSGAGSSSYDLAIDYTDSSGTTSYRASDVLLVGGSSHAVQYASLRAGNTDVTVQGQ